MTVERKDESLGFELSKARIRHLFSTTPEKSYEYFLEKANQDKSTDNLSNHQIGNLYGLALSLVNLAWSMMLNLSLIDSLMKSMSLVTSIFSMQI